MNILTSDWRSNILVWSSCLENFFYERRIYLQYPWKTSDVYKDGDRIRIQKRAFIGPYANMPKGTILGLGSFSYSRTVSMDPDFCCGNYCSLATGIQLSAEEHPLDRVSTHPFTTHSHMRDFARKEFGADWVVDPFRKLGPAPEIGHDVWIGKDVMLKRGIKIGTGAVIAARSVVTKDVPPYAIVGGVPAKLIRKRFNDQIIEELLQSSWWDYMFVDFPKGGFGSIESFLDQFHRLKSEGKLRRVPEKIALEKDLFAFIEENKESWSN